MTISANAFIEKWGKSRLKERAAAQEHFLDLCRLLEHPTPAEADPDGTWYTFEYPDRIVPVDKAAEKILSKRTLTNLYNENPTWLKNAHRELDDAVAEAYGWPTDLTDDEILEKLFALNQQRAKAGA